MINLQDTSPQTIVGNNSNRFLDGIDGSLLNEIYQPQNMVFSSTSTAAAALGLCDLAGESASNRHLIGASEDRKKIFPLRVRPKGIDNLEYDVYRLTTICRCFVLISIILDPS